MKNLILFSSIILIATTACNSAPEGFCECLKKGEELNKLSNKVLSGDVSEETKKKLIELREEKKTRCVKFETSTGPQMREWKESCN